MPRLVVIMECPRLLLLLAQRLFLLLTVQSQIFLLLKLSCHLAEGHRRFTLFTRFLRGLIQRAPELLLVLWVVHVAILYDVLYHGRDLGLVETNVTHVALAYVALAGVVLVIGALDAAEIFIGAKLLLWYGQPRYGRLVDRLVKSGVYLICLSRGLACASSCGCLRRWCLEELGCGLLAGA